MHAFVLTLGSDGAVYYDGKEKVFQDIFKVKAVDTTAAGDTFTGYFIACSHRGQIHPGGTENGCKGILHCCFKARRYTVHSESG